MEKYSPNKAHIVMTADQVRQVDSWAINTLGIPGAVLMENAGRSCAELIIDKLPDKDKPKVSIFCGTGNNGGDGYVIARHLSNAHIDVTVIICGNPTKITGDAKTNLDILKNLNHPIKLLDLIQPDIPTRIKTLTADSDIIVDAIFGTGLKGQLREDYKELIDTINALNIQKLSVDIPSGLDCDTGSPLDTAVKADYTVTFVALKKGFTTNPRATDYTGEIYIASIGVNPPAN